MMVVEISEAGVNGLSAEEFERLAGFVRGRRFADVDARLVKLVRRELDSDEELADATAVKFPSSGADDGFFYSPVATLIFGDGEEVDFEFEGEEIDDVLTNLSRQDTVGSNSVAVLDLRTGTVECTTYGS